MAKEFLSDITVDGNVSVTDEAYGIGWDSSLEVPTKNALYDKIETLGGGIGGSITDNQIAVGAATADDIEGNASFTFDSTLQTMNIGSSSVQGVIQIDKPLAGTSSIKFWSGGVGDGYIQYRSDELMRINATGGYEFFVGGSSRWEMTTERLWSGNSGGAALRRANVTLTVPGFTRRDDLTSGIGVDGSFGASIISNNKVGVLSTDAGTGTNVEIGGNVGSFGSTTAGEGVLRLNDVITDPGGTLTSGGLLYIKGISLNFMDDAGTVTDLTAGGGFTSFTIDADTGLSNSITDGETFTLTGGTGIDTNVTDNTVTFSLDFSELTDMTGDVGDNDEFILQDGGVESRKAANEIKLSVFNDDRDYEKTVVVENPGASENILIGFFDYAITVNEIAAAVNGLGPSVTFNIRHATTRNTGSYNTVLTSNTAVTSTSGTNITTGFNDATIPVNSWVWLVTTATGGAPTRFDCCMIYTRD